MISKTFCVLPWMHIATNSTGKLRVCCSSKPGSNYILDPSGKPYDLRTDIGEAWNSATYKTIRTQMLNDERPEMCIRCYREEDAGIKSPRINWNRNYAHMVDGLIAETNSDGSAPEKFVYLDLRLGNLCNLKCRMCNPYSSNQMVEEWQELNPEQDLAWLKNINWFEDEAVWTNLGKYIEYMDEIYLTGGEPTLATAQYRLYDMLIESGRAEHVVLKYNTNLTNLQPKLLDYWQHFKRIKLNASIDGYDKINNYIRFPTNWKSVNKNINKLKQIPHVNLGIHCTVQVYNIFELIPFLDWCKTLEIFPFLNLLNHPSHFNIKILPKSFKETCDQQLHAWLDTNRLWLETYDKDNNHQKLFGIIDYMNADDWEKQHKMEFIRHTKLFDKYRGQNFADIWPALSKYWEIY